MEKILKIRKIIFIVFFTIFIFGAVLIGFYSNGWQLDLKTFRFEKTGAIFYSPVIHFAEQLGQYRGTQSR